MGAPGVGPAGVLEQAAARRSGTALLAASLLLGAALLTAGLVWNERAIGPTDWWLRQRSSCMARAVGRPAPLPKLPWAPLLSEEEARRGVSHMGGGARLRAAAAKLLEGRPLTAITLGGSVTYGHGVEDQALAYPARFFHFLNTSWPNSAHVLLNRGMPGSTAPVTAPCAAAMVPPGADLVVLEFSINESPGDFSSRGRQAFEGLLRTLLALPGRPAVLLLHAYPWWRAAGDGAAAGLFYREPEGQLDTFAQYYDLPSLSMRSAAWRLMHAGVEGLKVDRVILPGSTNAATGEPIPAAAAGTEASYAYLDTVHPGPSGHQVLAELLAGALSQAAAEVLDGRAPAARGDPRLDGLPPPMIPRYEGQRSSLCLQLEEFKPVVRQQQGFTYRPEKPQLPRWVEQKWGWSATEPGSWAELEVDTRLPPDGSDGSGGGAEAVPGGTQMQLSHLRSYSGMGTADVECVSGCTCKPSVLDGTSASRVSVFKVHAFKVSRHARCRVRVTVRRAPGAVPQEGHKVTLAAVMVVHAMR